MTDSEDMELLRIARRVPRECATCARVDLYYCEAFRCRHCGRDGLLSMKTFREALLEGCHVRPGAKAAAWRDGEAVFQSADIGDDGCDWDDPWRWDTP